MMETSRLKKFAQFARRSLKEQVSTKLKLVLAENSSARRENTEAIKKLEEAIKNTSKEQVAERVAYIWFNRFCALRFMDVNRYTRIGVVSPTEGQFQPEILAEAKMGNMDEDVVPEKRRQQVFALLDGKAPSRDPQGEAYRLLVVSACNFWNKAMPFLFQRIDDYTELLMPDDLLSGNSILAYTREAMTPDACEDVEVIGWLYQFYISEKKDEVFDGLKKNKKITPENIPAATQLFTPHWIVRYLVENSLGRLWLLNRPGSKLVEQMDYYIKPEQPESDFLKIGSPEEIRICDPACGSGHMLTYAFDLLYAIYEEEGYEPAEIPEKILTHNLYGVEIDERAGELAAFALTMKARAKQRRFFNKGVKPNICVLENVHFDEDELKDYMDFVGRNLFTAQQQTTLRQFEEAVTLGSLIRPKVAGVDGLIRTLEAKDVSGQLFLNLTHQNVLRTLRQADYLNTKYHVVVTNPPYMKGTQMSPSLKAFTEKHFKQGKANLFAVFLEHLPSLTVSGGLFGMINMHGWMFTARYEALRKTLVRKYKFCCVSHLGAHAFDSISGEVVQTTMFVLANSTPTFGKTVFHRLVDGRNEKEKDQALLARENEYRVATNEFFAIEGEPIAYWMPKAARDAFAKFSSLGDCAEIRAGMQTGDNDTFLRYWHEIDWSKTGIGFGKYQEAKESGKKWFPYNKGGGFRKWFGLQEYVINWYDDGAELKAKKEADLKAGRITKNNSKCWNQDYYFLRGISWSALTTGSMSARDNGQGFLFDTKGPTIFPTSSLKWNLVLAFLNSRISTYLLEALSPTLDFHGGTVSKLPLPDVDDQLICISVAEAVAASRSDWNASEQSWEFTTSPLLYPGIQQQRVVGAFKSVIEYQSILIERTRECEERINSAFIAAFGLSNVVDSAVDRDEITLSKPSPYSIAEEFVSYAVGCMFGRYALEKPGLILANQGNTIEDYLEQIPEPSFPADDDNVIPMLDGDWFTDDIAERFRKFLRVAFGEQHYEENLRFAEQALNIKGKRNYSIRDYFLGEFYTDHVKRYKKRPIYWLFSSPKGSFNALIYMHRYRPDTVSVVLNDYLREFRGKLSTQLDHLRGVEASADASKGEKTKALKEIEKLKKILDELDTWEREVMYPLATEQIAIDLDDGVKVNYPKFGAALKKVTGL